MKGIYALFFSHLLAFQVFSQNPGELDFSFGNGGKAFPDPSALDSYLGVVDIEILPNGKILAAYIAYVQGYTRFGLARFNDDGNLDTQFGAMGKATVQFNNTANEVNAMKVQPDGKILLAGYTVKDQVPFVSDFAVARFLENGALDAGFGSGGKVTIDINPTSTAERAFDIVVQSDGKIIVAGDTYPDNITYSDIALVRLLPGGALDASFGIGGKAKKHIFGNDHLEALSLDQNGDILTAGSVLGGQFGMFVRFLKNGQVDLNVNSGAGYVLFGAGQGMNDLITSVKSDADGKILLTGYTCQNQPCTQATAWLFRLFGNNGFTDTSFGNNGLAPGTFNAINRFNAIEIQINGKILTAGATGADQANLDFLIARYLSNGQLDPDFGLNGIVTTDLQGSDNINCLALQNNGKLLAGGGSYYQGSEIPSMARYFLTGNSAVSQLDKDLILSIMPNPFDDHIRIDFQLSGDESITFSLKNFTGETIVKQTSPIEQVDGRGTAYIPVPRNLPPGAYLLYANSQQNQGAAIVTKF